MNLDRKFESGVLNKDLDSSIRSNTLNSKISNSDLVLLVNTNLKEELPLLFVKLRKHILKTGVKAGFVGNNYNLPEAFDHLGFNVQDFLSIVEGNHSFSSDVVLAKNPLVLFNENCMGLDISSVNSILKKMNPNIKTAVINTDISYSSLFELGYNVSPKNVNGSIDINFDIGSDIKYSLKDNSNFNIFIGSHGGFNNLANEKGFMSYDLILPSLTFVEKNSSYINFDGIFQNSQKISSLVPSARSEESIIKTLLFYLTQKNSDLFFSNTVSTSVFDKFKLKSEGDILGLELNNEATKIIGLGSNFKSSIDKYYLSNAFASSSKVMAECQLVNNKKNNF